MTIMTTDMTKDQYSLLAIILLVAALVAVILFGGCTVAYEVNADGTKRVTTGFNPTEADAKAIVSGLRNR